MPRTGRIRSSTGIYHIMLRGINNQIIFNDDEDYDKFIEILLECKNKSNFKIFAYCLMGNHVHLLLKEETDALEIIFKRLGVNYVYWYNGKYIRVGHLFQDRFKSEVVENESYLLAAVRYIHKNPLKAMIVSSMTEYYYSSYNEYISPKPGQLTDTGFIIDIVGEEEFLRFHEIEDNKEAFMDIPDLKRRMTDGQVKIAIQKITGQSNTLSCQHFDKQLLGKYIKKLRKEGASIRQLRRLMGISEWIIRNNS